MKKQPIFVAVDTNNLKRATQIVNATNKYIYGVKFGLEFFCSKEGREAVKKFKNKNVKIFLDLKLKDIPNTVYKAIKSLKDVNPDYLTIHASGGRQSFDFVCGHRFRTGRGLRQLEQCRGLRLQQHCDSGRTRHHHDHRQPGRECELERSHRCFPKRKGYVLAPVGVGL